MVAVRTRVARSRNDAALPDFARHPRRICAPWFSSQRERLVWNPSRISRAITRQRPRRLCRCCAPQFFNVGHHYICSLHLLPHARPSELLQVRARPLPRIVSNHIPVSFFEFIFHSLAGMR